MFVDELVRQHKGCTSGETGDSSRLKKCIKRYDILKEVIRETTMEAMGHLTSHDKKHGKTKIDSSAG